MKASGKKLLPLALLAALCALAGLSFWMKGHSWREAASQGDSASLSAFDANAIEKISISWKDSKATLLRKDGAWLLQERFGHPADSSKVASLLKTLSSLKPVKVLEGCDEGELKSLNLSESPGKGGVPGVKIGLCDKDGKELFGILLGKGVFQKDPGDPGGFESKAPAGRYALCLRPDGKPLVFISSKLFEEYPPTPQAWLEPLRLRWDGLKSMSVSPSKSQAWEISRLSAKDKFDFIVPKGAVVSRQALVAMLSAFSKPSATDVLPKDAIPGTELSESCVVDMETFEGLSYKFILGIGRGKAFLKMDMNYVPQEGAGAEPQARFENGRRLSGWTYEIPSKLAAAVMACPDGRTAQSGESSGLP